MRKTRSRAIRLPVFDFILAIFFLRILAIRWTHTHTHSHTHTHTNTHTHAHAHTHTHTHTHTHDDGIRRNAMRCISPKNWQFHSLPAVYILFSSSNCISFHIFPSTYATTNRSERYVKGQDNNNTINNNTKMFDIENESQGNGEQDSKWSHPTTNVKLYESHTWAFFTSSHRFRDIHI